MTAKSDTLTMRDCKTAFAIPGQNNIIDVIHPVTGLSLCYGESLEQVRIRHPGAEIVECDKFFADNEGIS